MKIPRAAILLIAAICPASIVAAQSAQSAPAQTPAAPQPAPKSSSPRTHTDPLGSVLQQAQDDTTHGDFAAAIPLLQEYLVRYPDSEYAHFELGYADAQLKHDDDAKSEFELAIAINPKMAEAHLNLGLLLLDSDPASAATAFAHAAELTPTESRPRFLYGLALEHAGKLDEAVVQYQKAALLAPNDYEIAFGLARALVRLNRSAEAEAEFRRAVALKANSAPAQLGLAQSLEAQKKYSDAADVLNVYLKLQPADRAAHEDRAYALMQTNQFDAALAELDLAQAGAAPDANSLKMRAGIYMQQSHWKDAAATLQQAIPLSPADPELYAWLGRSLLELRQFPESTAALNKSLSIDGAAVDPLRDLVDAYYLGGDCPSALATLDLLSAREPLKPIAWFVRGTCYDKLARKPEAIAAYQKYLDLDQGSHDTQDFQARQRILALQRQMQKRQ
ncbi:MAG: tetratricopeptide repeat protein [Candidatus Acidiferrales bacterium]